MGLVVDIHSHFGIKIGIMVAYSMWRLLLEDYRHLILLWGGALMLQILEYLA